MSELRKSLLNKNSKSFGLGKIPQDFSPSKPTDYFDKEEQITTSNGTFHVYKKGNSGPIICCLHGGGYSGLTWALFAVEICNNIECQVVTIDLRGHGLTATEDDTNLSLPTLAKDVVNVIMKFPEGSPVVLIGHSMGGAIAVESAHLLGEIVVGLCVIDVVEGTALEALSSMQSFLRSRPSSFKSIEDAIQWCYKSGQTRNIEAARISMPGQIIKCKSPVEKTNNVFSLLEADEDVTSEKNFQKPPLPDNVSKPSTLGTENYVWRIDLRKTEQFWKGWFQGLSNKFLELHIPKILLLANVHGLDTALTVGQMQGKFQFQVLSKSGHAIHEDQPHQVAEIISVYLVKHKLANPREGFEVPLPKMFM